MTTTSRPTETLEPEEFLHRHVGPREEDVREMLEPLGFDELDDLIEATVPASIRLSRPLALPAGLTEPEALASTREVASANTVMRSYIGMGYSDCHTPPVIQRNILENPGWYTAYTPYQAEIAQGRLEALLNFQTMVLDLTGLEIANASLLDEGTAAAEAMAMSYATRGKEGKEVYFVSQDCHPQTIDVVRTRATVRGITVVVGDHRTFELGSAVFGALLQYPASDGAVHEYAAFVQRAHAAEAVVTVATDLLALTLLTPPGEWGADIAVGSAQRFGVPMGYGGPHAAFLAAKDAFKRTLPGRIIGVSRDSSGRPALRMALQTREQHIRREKATSNVCTAQVLLAVMAGMYAVYHGPRGLRRIAERIHRLAVALANGLEGAGVRVTHDSFFDTLRIDVGEGGAERAAEAARERGMNLRVIDDSSIGIALDETTTVADVEELLEVLGARAAAVDGLVEDAGSRLGGLARTSDYLTHQVFNRYHSETEMQRYMRRLESRDLSLVHSMIPLGSCTMKLNAAAEMFPISWPEFARMHPFAPREQAEGYRRMFEELESILAEFTGFAGVSLQPNAGSQGEFAGLMVIRRYHDSRGDAHRNVCLIPQSAHGTNPASAVMAGMKVVVVRTDGDGNIAMDDLRAKIEQHREALAALMVTYPSTHGVFEEGIREVCDLIHQGGGQVYLDGANMNAMVGLARPGDFGADVCHLNLHKTFCIPHGGGGPGMGPIGVAEHLVPFLPGHPVIPVSGDAAVGAISAAPWGSASILPISYMYVKMMGGAGLTYATKIAILNANYIAKRLEEHYPVLYQGRNGTVAHECILDTRPLKSAGIEVEDIAKRLIDYGFHAPTVSFPVAGTLMIEPTESESKEELDRFCDAMIAIREEVAAVERGEMDRADNPLKRAPHTVEAVSADVWDRPYSRQQAAFPLDWVRDGKFWPAVGRVESAYGDRNLVCSCPPTDSYVR